MREIKFRARRVGGSQEWVYFTLKSLLKVHTLDMNGTFKDWCEYTGLKDKNGKEIFESDLVNVLEQWINKKDDSDIAEQNPYNLQVTFVNYEWELINFYKNENGIVMPHQPIIKLPDYSEGFSWGNGLEIWGHNNFEYKQRFSEFEVIGNIYENKELLNESK